MYVLKHPKIRFALTTVLLLKTKSILFARKKISKQRNKHKKIKRQKIKRQKIKRQNNKRQRLITRPVTTPTRTHLLDEENLLKNVKHGIRDETVTSSSINQRNYNLIKQ